MSDIFLVGAATVGVAEVIIETCRASDGAPSAGFGTAARDALADASNACDEPVRDP